MSKIKKLANRSGWLGPDHGCGNPGCEPDCDCNVLPPDIDLSGLGAAGLIVVCGPDRITPMFVCWRVNVETGLKEFFLPDGTDVVPNADFFPCEEPAPVDPDCVHVGVMGDAVAGLVGEFNQIDVYNPTCCLLQVTTDLGTFLVPPLQAFSSAVFECALGDLSLAFVGGGDCPLSDVVINLSYTGV